MKKVYQLEKGQLAISVSYIHTDDGIVKEVLAKLVAIAATCLVGRALYTESIKYLQLGEISKLFSVILFGILLLALIAILYHAFFQRDWRKKIRITDLKEIKVDIDEGNEVEIQLSFQNNRKKSFIFRKLEKEYERFLHDIKKSSNCAIIYETN